MVHDHFIVEGPEKWNLWLPRNLKLCWLELFDLFYRLVTDLYPVEIVIERVDHDEDIAELGRNDSSPVVSPVLSPDDVDLIVP